MPSPVPILSRFFLAGGGAGSTILCRLFQAPAFLKQFLPFLESGLGLLPADWPVQTKQPYLQRLSAAPKPEAEEGRAATPGKTRGRAETRQRAKKPTLPAEHLWSKKSSSMPPSWQHRKAGAASRGEPGRLWG